MSGQVFRLYMLRCSDGSLYTGIATDIERRLREHACSSRGAKYLRGRAPFELVFDCVAGERDAAQKLESRIKRLSRGEKQRLVDGALSIDELDELHEPGTVPRQASGVSGNG